jgi:hypothetical protein
LKISGLSKDFWIFDKISYMDSYWKNIDSIKYLPRGRKTHKNAESTIFLCQWPVSNEIKYIANILDIVELHN